MVFEALEVLCILHLDYKIFRDYTPENSTFYKGSYMNANSKGVHLLETISLILFIVAGLNWFAPSLIRNTKFIQSSTELPLAHLQGIVADQQGNVYIGIQFYERIQLYDTTGNFQKGWFVNTAGGSFRLKMNELNQLEVATARTNLHYIFDQDGNIVALNENSDAYGDFGDTNEYVYKSEDGTNYTISLPTVWPQIVKSTSQNPGSAIISVQSKNWVFIGIFPALLLGLLAILFSSLAYKRSHP